jgi:hypothetical protein
MSLDTSHNAESDGRGLPTSSPGGAYCRSRWPLCWRSTSVRHLSAIPRKARRKPMTISGEARRAVNEGEVRRYFSSWDPTWRWILILGLRDMRANLGRLGQLATKEMGNDAWN